MLKILALSSRKEKLLFALAVFLIIIATIAEISQPLFFSAIGQQIAKVEEGNPDSSIISSLIGWCAGMLGTVLLGMAGTLIAIKVVSYASTSLIARSRMLLFNKILNLSTSKIDEYGVSSLVVRTTNDLIQVRDSIYLMFTLIIKTPIYIIVGFSLAMLVLAPLSSEINGLHGDQFLLATSFIVIPIMVLIGLVLVYFARKYFAKQRVLLDENNQIMSENIIGRKIIRAFRIQKNQETRFSVVNSGLMKNSRRAEVILHSFIPLIVLSLNLAIVSIQIIFAVLAEKIGFSNPKLIETLQIAVQTFMQFFSLILVGLVLFGSSLFVTQRSKPSAQRINEILEVKSMIVDGSSNKKINNASIEFRNVHFRYAASKNKSDIDTISNINFKIEAGQTLGIIGSTGSGKSTLVSLISRFYDATKGEILIDGLNIKSYKLDELTSAISVAFQEKILFKGTIKSNILVGKWNATNDEILNAAKNAEAYEFIEGRDKQFEAPVEEEGSNLSGGQKQRLSIARALIKKPKILVFDDSLSALDNITETKLLKNIKTNFKDMTLLIVAQRVKSIQNADKIIILEDGHISGIGTHDELLKNNDLYQQIYDSQNTEIGE